MNCFDDVHGGPRLGRSHRYTGAPILTVVDSTLKHLHGLSKVMWSRIYDFLTALRQKTKLKLSTSYYRSKFNFFGANKTFLRDFKIVGVARKFFM